MVVETNQVAVDNPKKANWAFIFPKANNRADEWQKFAVDVLSLPLGPNTSGEKCKDEIRKWQLKYHVNESESAMLHEEKNTWGVVIENLRVRKINTKLSYSSWISCN